MRWGGGGGVVGLERTMARRSATLLLGKHEESGAADPVFLNGPLRKSRKIRVREAFCFCHFQHDFHLLIQLRVFPTFRESQSSHESSCVVWVQDAFSSCEGEGRMELCYEPVLVKQTSLKREVKKVGTNLKEERGPFFFSHQLFVRKGTGTARCGSL